MPICYCFTTLSSSDIPENFETKLSECVANVLSKPIERIAVIVNPNARICKAGSTDVAFIMQIHSIGVFDAERNPGYYSKFFDFLTTSLKMPANRMTIQLVDIPPHGAKSGQ